MSSIKEVIKEFEEINPKLSGLLLEVLQEIEQDKEKFIGQDISVLLNQLRYRAIDKEIDQFSSKWFLPVEDVKYEVYHYKDGELANENKLKDSADYTAYKENTEGAMPKFKFNQAMLRDFKETLMPEIIPLLD